VGERRIGEVEDLIEHGADLAGGDELVSALGLVGVREVRA
jgi:hypothetical protein